MAEKPFKPGDVVVLKSGGPPMTVSQCDQDSFGGEMTVWCSWFEKNKPMKDTFPAAVVKIYEGN
jgi:uncharacterized protein YodC (DUF2158 family)